MKTTIKTAMFLSALLLAALVQYSNAQWSTSGNAGTTPVTNYLGTSDPTDLSISTGGVEKIRVQSGGNIGIGVSAPVQKLDVSGNINLNGTFGLYQKNKRIFIADGAPSARNTFAGYQAGNANAGIYCAFLGYQSGYSNTANNNVFLGASSGKSNTTGEANAFTGMNSGYSNTTGLYNTFNGFYAGYGNTTASYNTFIGATTGSSNTSGTQNTFVGALSGTNNTTGSYNTFLGDSSGFSNTSGYSNTFTGEFCGVTNTTGYQNAFYGVSAGAKNTSGFKNTFIGKDAAFYNAGGSQNVMVGQQAGYSNTSAGQNTFIGNQAGYLNTTGGFNVFVGHLSGGSNTTGASNTFTGTYSGGSNTTGENNAAFGRDALYFNSVGSENTAVGSGSMNLTTTGSDNSCIGYHALYLNGTGNHNSAGGAFALAANNGASENTGFGYNSLYSNNSGTNNTAVGSNALKYGGSYSYNTAIGFQSGVAGIFGDQAIGNNNTFLGAYTSSDNGASYNNSTAIGYGAQVKASNSFVLGNGSVTKWGFGVGAGASNIIQFANTTAKLTTGGAWTNASDPKLKDQIEELNTTDILSKVNLLKIQRWHYRADHEPVTHIGPMADQFHELFKTGDDSTISTIDPSGVALLSIQALSAENKQLQNQSTHQEEELNKLSTTITGQALLIEELQAQVNELKVSIVMPESAMNDGFAKLSFTASDDIMLLGQNVPNPFENSTLIPFRLPKDCHNASIMITNRTTAQVVTVIPVSSNEKHIQVDAGTLASGAYSYTLTVDGKIIDTKEMVITK